MGGSRAVRSCGPVGIEYPGGSTQHSQVGILTAERARVSLQRVVGRELVDPKANGNVLCRMDNRLTFLYYSSTRGNTKSGA